MNQYFSDFFEVSPDIIEDYGAFNISLISDLPLFIDPFLLFNSQKEEYRQLHDKIIEYLAFLREKSANQELSQGLIRAWYKFSEVKQNWLGFSATDNSGSGLGNKFAIALHDNLYRIFRDFGQEQVTHGSHLEKLCLIGSGVGRDNISDFTTNLIKEFLLDYTQEFARRHLAKRFRQIFPVERVRFNHDTESWERGRYELPSFNGDYVLLTPFDMLTKDETWINRPELVESFGNIAMSVPDDSLRAQLNNFFEKRLHEIVGRNQEKKKHRTEAANDTINEFPAFIDYYIRYKEENGDDAENISSAKVAESKRLYLDQFSQLGEQLALETEFYNLNGSNYSEAFRRIQILKNFIENDGGHRIFYIADNPVDREDDLHILFRLTWKAKSTNAQSMIDSSGGSRAGVSARSRFRISVKLGRNSQLKRTLEKQIDEYDEVATEQKSIIVIFYFIDDEFYNVRGLLRQLGIEKNQNIVLIDARNVRAPLHAKAKRPKVISFEEPAKMNTNFTNGYALLVGVGADLPMTVRDATGIRDVLVNPQRAAYPANQVQLLTENDATRQVVLDAFDRLIEQSNKNPDATVIVYYSGHGGRIENGIDVPDYFIVPFGYDPVRFTETTISSREFTTKIQAINARTLLVLLDCCHAGGVPVLKSAGDRFVKVPAPPDLLDVLSQGGGRVIVASSREDEYSIGADPYSIFTACLLEALSGSATRNFDGYARILDVLSYVYEQVPQRTNDEQHPFVNNITDLSDNFAICYYAGGSKQVSGIPNPSQVLPTNRLTANGRGRLERKLAGLRSEYDLLNEKIRRMRQSLIIETNVAVKFQLEQQLLNEEAGLSKLESGIEEIEDKLED